MGRCTETQCAQAHSSKTKLVVFVAAWGLKEITNFVVAIKCHDLRARGILCERQSAIFSDV